MHRLRKRSNQWYEGHGEIEVYDSNRHHLGAIDGIEGYWTSGPDPKGRRPKQAKLEDDGTTKFT